MEPKEHYTPKDFERFARKDFPDEFDILRGIYTSDFENKTYLDANNAAHNLSVLFVGNYHKRRGGPPVWAQATTTGVRYFQGKSDESVITLIRHKHVTRIYFAAPYSSLVMSQEGKGGTAGRRAGHHVVETIINILFLLAGLVEKVNNPDKTDMLSNFKVVCMNSSRSEVQEIAHYTVPRPTERESKKRKRSSSVERPRIKQEEVDTDGIVCAGQIVQHQDRLAYLTSPLSASHSLLSITPQHHSSASLLRHLSL